MIKVGHVELSKAPYKPSHALQAVQSCLEERRKLVNDRTRYSNRLTACLKMYFPQVLDWFFDVTTEVACGFLERWPTLQKAQRARPQTLRKFFLEHRSARKLGVDSRLADICRAIPATRDEAVVRSCSAAVAALVRILRAVRVAIGSYDEQIETLARQHPGSDPGTIIL